MCVFVLLLHVGQRHLGDSWEAAQGVQGVLGEVRNSAEVCVQKAPGYFKRLLPRPAEPCQDAEAAFALHNPGQLQLHPAAGHARNCCANPCRSTVKACDKFLLARVSFNGRHSLSIEANSCRFSWL